MTTSNMETSLLKHVGPFRFHSTSQMINGQGNTQYIRTDTIRGVYEAVVATGTTQPGAHKPILAQPLMEQPPQLGGLWQGETITDAEIAAARREMWGNFPRDDF